MTPGAEPSEGQRPADGIHQNRLIDLQMPEIGLAQLKGLLLSQQTRKELDRPQFLPLLPLGLPGRLGNTEAEEAEEDTELLLLPPLLILLPKR